ncbi:MAG: hypothetical protein KIT35_02975 [Piscinibacter sp.]|uniref:hypothetical protein n=1 Tax=Piscinibacter sp. TaxID=1903157 RepID=UPI00258C0940|nr:hypothetical protein [Piscinibacter sp.]MCW5662775.1 hypothetical protein [Piscinibacter sp.]
MSQLHRGLPALLLLAAVALAPAARAETPKAAERCESEVSDTIRRMRGKEVQDVQYIAGRRVLTPATDDETSVRGEGRYRIGGTTVPFTYSCAYNAKSDSASGALFRDLVTARAPAEKAFEPDLTNLSPDACESAAAGSLKSRHPRVGRIVFGSDSRRIQPGSNGAVLLVGQGAVQRAAGMNAVPFTYRCEMNPRSGRVLEVSTSD